MIKSFKNKGARDIFNGKPTKDARRLLWLESLLSKIFEKGLFIQLNILILRSALK